jgi:hypothetical protein
VYTKLFGLGVFFFFQNLYGCQCVSFCVVMQFSFTTQVTCLLFFFFKNVVGFFLLVYPPKYTAALFSQVKCLSVLFWDWLWWGLAFLLEDAGRAELQTNPWRQPGIPMAQGWIAHRGPGCEVLKPPRSYGLDIVWVCPLRGYVLESWSSGWWCWVGGDWVIRKGLMWFSLDIG